MSTQDIQAKFDKWFPRGVNLQFVLDTPADPSNAQYFVPRVIVRSTDSGGYEIYMDAMATGKEWTFRIQRAPEDYGSTENLTALLFQATNDDVLYMTSHITDDMDRQLREFERSRPWFKEARRG